MSLEFDRSGKWKNEEPLCDGYTTKVTHFTIYVQNDHCVDFFIRMGYEHEALEFDFVHNGVTRKYTVDFTEDGVVRRWGYYRKKERIIAEKQVNYYYDELIDKTHTNKRYSLLFYNCISYSREKFKEL